jgi:hypothetical protein
VRKGHGGSPRAAVPRDRGRRRRRPACRDDGLELRSEQLLVGAHERHELLVDIRTAEEAVTGDRRDHGGTALSS